MATFTPVGNKIRAQIRRVGQPSLTKTFEGKTLAEAEKEARKWARLKESEIDAGKQVGVHGKKGVRFGEAVNRYLTDVKDLGKTTMDILGYLNDGLGGILLEKMTANDIVQYIQKKNFGSPMSGAMHFSFFCSVMRMAKVGWKYAVADVLIEARDTLKVLELIGTSEERDRRPTPKEIQMLLEYDFPTPIPMKDIIQFAICSAMRQAEITRIEHGTFDQDHKTVVITDRKHPTKKKGNNQIVPLLDASIEIIKRQERKEGDDRIFPFASPTIGTYFTAACKKLGIIDLHFHDLRHEAASRLFEMGYQIQEVAMFTGHLDWKMLKRYTHLKAKNIRRIEPAKVEPATIQTGGIVMDAATLEQFKMFQAMQAMMAQQKAA